MTPAEMVKALAAEGVTVSLTTQGGISLKGDTGAVGRWSAVLKSRKSDLVSYLTAQKAILDWLHRIEEGDPKIIAEVLRRCNASDEALTYFLYRATHRAFGYEINTRNTTQFRQSACS